MQGFPFFYSPFAPTLAIAITLFVLALALWTVVLKGLSLWHAARAGQKGWFVALLLLNTLGILEIVYLIWFRPKAGEKKEAPVIVSSASPKG